MLLQEIIILLASRFQLELAGCENVKQGITKKMLSHLKAFNYI